MQNDKKLVSAVISSEVKTAYETRIKKEGRKSQFVIEKLLERYARGQINV